ncbi:BA75_04093T0 [Komagataella pastoris]|uniref:BA75_04093T0 n=1 Tax=Komagataella pastoris TaxID=4922 RepID=A0A1B2JG56_PICPA|nr:BA75_04093T0 [Komagataella pastoris]
MKRLANVSTQEEPFNVLDEFTQNRSGPKKKRKMLLFSDLNSSKVGSVSAGTITKVTMINFMAYDNFEVLLGPQISFITGNNGQGKSTILSALTVGLGARAGETDRGSNFKSFIKDDRNKATIIIEICNEGASAYKPEVFGEQITVERVIIRDGPQRYIVKNAKGKEVSSKKKDLVAMLKYFGIHITNPMAIINQSAAKEFLRSTSPSQLFKYFMQSTQLHDSMAEHMESELEIKKLSQQLVQLKEDLEELKLKEQDAQSLYSKYQDSEKIQQNLQLLIIKRAWCIVQTRENAIKSHTERIERNIAAKDQAAQKIEENNDKTVKLDDLKDTFNKKALEIKKDLDKLDVSIQKHKSALPEYSKKVSELKADIKSTNQEKRQYEEKCVSIKESIEEETEQQALRNGRSFEDWSRRKTDKEQQVAALSKQLTTTEQEYKNLKDSKEASFYDYQDKSSSLRSELRQLEQMKISLSQSSANVHDLYHGNLKALLASIEKDTRFHNKPIGPLGFYITLKPEHKQWAVLLETMLDQSLNSFIVQDYHDQQLLSSLLRKYRITNMNVLKRKNEKFEYGHHKPTGNFETVQDLLEISSEAVEYILVDMNRIHQTLLIESPQDALDAISSRPAHVTRIWSLYNRKSGSACELRNGTLATDPIRYKFNSGRISNGGPDTQDGLKQIASDIANVEARIHRLNSDYKEQNATIQRQLKELETNSSKLKLKIQSLNAEIEDITENLNDDSSTGKVEALQQELKHYETQVSIKLAELTDFQSSLEEAERNLKERKSIYNDALQQKNERTKQLSDVENHLVEMETQQDLCRKNSVQQKEYIAKRERKIEDIRTKIEDYEVKLRSEMETAVSFNVPREELTIEDDETLETIEGELEANEEELVRIQNVHGKTYEEVLSNLKEAQEEYSNALSNIEKIVNLRDSLVSGLAERVEHLSQIKETIAQDVNVSFKQAMRIKSHFGKVKIDFNKQELHLSFSKTLDGEPKSVSTASGGEKGFAQIAFLLAIWKHMDCKIRAMDEFEVFMDDVSKNLTIKMILDRISNEYHRQTIFISPLKVDDVPELEDASVRILRVGK